MGIRDRDLRWLPWFAVPGRRSADLKLVFGHWAALGYYRAPGVYALDSGCVWGNRPVSYTHLDVYKRQA